MYAIRKNGMVCAVSGGDGEHTLCGKDDPKMANMTRKISVKGVVTCPKCIKIIKSVRKLKCKKIGGGE